VRKRPRRKRTRPISLHYGDAAFMDQIPRLTDLIPRSLWPYGLLLLLGIGIIGGLEWLYGAVMPRLAPWTTDGTVEAFDLDGEGTLAVWFSSTTLLLASGVSGIVYLVRRYRRDDYQGRYRIWLWAAGCWLLMSLDETASLHEGFKKMMTLLTGQSLGGDGSLWWAIPYFFLLGGVGIRLLVDMRECLLSAGTFLAVAICYATAVAAQLEWILPQSGSMGIMLEEGAEMLGDWLLLLAMTLYARHVILDAEGRLESPGQKRSGISARSGGDTTATAAEASSVRTVSDRFASDRSVVVHPPQGIPSPSTARIGGDFPVGGTPASPGTTSSFPSGSSSAWIGSGAGSSSAGNPPGSPTSTGLAGGIGTSGTAPRRLTEAEKKALRRKLEKLRKQREG